METLQRTANRGSVASATAYEIDNSLKFEQDNSEQIHFTPSSAGNRRTWTFSCWLKRTELSLNHYIFNFGDEDYNQSGRTLMIFRTGVDQIWFGGGGAYELKTTQVFRDASAWYHIVLAVDTTQATDSNRLKLYINGEQVTDFDATSYPSQNFEYAANRDHKHSIGYNHTDNGEGFSGYMSEVALIDGQQLTPSSFGETDDDSGIWKPKDLSTLTFGSNGFYLKFDNSSSLGADSSGNTNNFTLSNITAADQATDTPTNNFCILNPNWVSANKLIPTNGGTVISGGNAWSGYKGSMGVKTGKWYFEVVKATGGTNANGMWGVGDDGNGPDSFNSDNAHEVGYNHLFYQESTYGYRIYTNSSGSAANDFNPGVSNSVAEGDVFGVALDMDNGKISFYKNGSNMYGSTLHDLGGLATASIYQGSVVPLFVNYSSLRELHVNFGGYCNTTPSSGASDANGYGNFEYAPPSGYYALCSKNIAQYDSPTIDDPSVHFQTALYSGTGSAQSITNDGNSNLQPDWVWWKRRDAAYSHGLVDSNRGTGKYLRSDSSNAEGTDYTYITSFDSDGFTIPSGDQSSNNSSGTYVAWQWKANGGTTSSNTDGSITSTVQANTTGGFSIVTFTGTGSTATVGHGLGAIPAMIIQKNRDSTANWSVKHHKTINNYDFLNLNLSSAATANDSIWTQTDPTTSVFSIGTSTAINQSGQDQVCYCFAEKEGYSKFGSYIGNGANDGPFIYTGFKPAFLLFKRVQNNRNWVIIDNKRDPHNVASKRLFPDGTSGDNVLANLVDLVSNGFKVRHLNVIINSSGEKYIYMAFAENPFAASTGIPTTAR